MARNERTFWVIPEDAGVVDSDGHPRTVTVRLVDGRVTLSASVAGDSDLVDARTWLSLPNDVAEQFGFHLQSAAETNRLRTRS